MNVRIFWVRAMKCMCAQTRPRFILSSERVFGGMEFEPMLTQPENVPRGGSNPRHRGQRAHALPTELFQPHCDMTVNRVHEQMDYCRRGLCMMCLWHDCEQSARANGLLQAWSVHDVFVTWLWTECTSKWTTAGVVCAWCVCDMTVNRVHEQMDYCRRGLCMMCLWHDCEQTARANGLLQAWSVHDVLVTWLWTECASKWTTAGVVCAWCVCDMTVNRVQE